MTLEDHLDEIKQHGSALETIKRAKQRAQLARQEGNLPTYTSQEVETITRYESNLTIDQEELNALRELPDRALIEPIAAATSRAEANAKTLLTDIIQPDYREAVETLEEENLYNVASLAPAFETTNLSELGSKRQEFAGWYHAYKTGDLKYYFDNSSSTVMKMLAANGSLSGETLRNVMGAKAQRKRDAFITQCQEEGVERVRQYLIKAENTVDDAGKKAIYEATGLALLNGREEREAEELPLAA